MRARGGRLTGWRPTGRAVAQTLGLGVISHPETAERLSGMIGTLAPILLSSMDNGWLVTGLRAVQRSVPELAARVDALFDGLDFSFYSRLDGDRILFFYAPSTGKSACCCDGRADRPLPGRGGEATVGCT